MASGSTDSKEVDTGKLDQIHHRASAKRFELVFADESTAFAEYSIEPRKTNAKRKKRCSDALEEKQVLDLFHTFTPSTQRGRGYAAKLCKHVFEYAQERAMSVRPSCSYVRDCFVPQHPQYTQLLVNPPKPAVKRKRRR
jgi:predicted GNAT family acetyltransferase